MKPGLSFDLQGFSPATLTLLEQAIECLYPIVVTTSPCLVLPFARLQDGSSSIPFDLSSFPELEVV